ncbi:MAG TPA: undecaprenyl-phosphate glucose phosphotransferase, partial [Verrucomicrobiae bacterium]|nr:undecaprenyl-phosphate glucose phosphotransferase [Verrucomicrobiae bacterium]
ANLDRILISFATGFLFLLAAAFALKVSETFSRTWVGTFGLTAVASTIVAKLLFSRAVLSLSRRGVFSRNLIIAGKKKHVSRLLDRLMATRPEFVNVTALFVEHPSDAVIGGQPVVGDLNDIAAFVRSFRVDDVVIAMPWSEEDRILGLVEQLRELPVNVYLGSDLIGLRLDFREPPEHFDKAPIFSIVGNPMSGWGVVIKAIENYVLALLFLAIAALPMMLIALLVKLDSPGPVLFRQKRLGFNNRVFSIYKFRSMRFTNAPDKKTVQATQSDPRVTRLGRFLRRSSLDELPQLFNVLEGTMSLVGPRPHAVDHNEEYARKIRGYFGRHRVKPGITGWAQVNGLRGETDTPDKMESRVRYDVFYTENWSLMF